MTTLRQLRKLILGETWSLPFGVGIALGAGGVGRALGGVHGWWHSDGGFVLLGLVALALSASLVSGLRAHRRRR